MTPTYTDEDICSNRSLCVYPTKSGKWEARAHIAGKTYRKTFQDFEEAKEWIAERRRRFRPCYGYTHSKLFNAWRHMRKRCSNPKEFAYERYGGRGITVCEQWNNSFPAFFEWAINNGYRSDLTIDRIDNDGNYCPENCRFVTMREQNNNKSNNLILTAFGVKKTMTEWSRDPRCVANAGALLARIKYGWDHERAITTPIRRRVRDVG